VCNEASRRIALDQFRVDWSALKEPFRFPEAPFPQCVKVGAGYARALAWRTAVSRP
jgi:hypothetical protein